MYDYEIEHICSYSAQLNTNLEMLGAVPAGIRLNAFVDHGEVTGPKLHGKFRKGGGDWATIRTDGILYLDVRGTLETDDGALIYITYNGVGDMGEDGYEKFQRGENPGIVQLRTAPMMQSSHPDYLWVNRLQFIEVGEVDFSTLIVSYDVYALK